MIRVDAPRATAGDMDFWADKGLNCLYIPATFGPGPVMTAGYLLILDEPDENWPALQEQIAAFAAAIGAFRLRVHFGTFDPSRRGDRLALPSCWVYSDGTQSEK